MVFFWLYSRVLRFGLWSELPLSSLHASITFYASDIHTHTQQAQYDFIATAYTHTDTQPDEYEHTNAHLNTYAVKKLFSESGWETDTESGRARESQWKRESESEVEVWESVGKRATLTLLLFGPWLRQAFRVSSVRILFRFSCQFYSSHCCCCRRCCCYRCYTFVKFVFFSIASHFVLTQFGGWKSWNSYWTGKWRVVKETSHTHTNTDTHTYTSKTSRSGNSFAAVDSQLIKRTLDTFDLLVKLLLRHWQQKRRHCHKNRTQQQRLCHGNWTLSRLFPYHCG